MASCQQSAFERLKASSTLVIKCNNSTCIKELMAITKMHTAIRSFMQPNPFTLDQKVSNSLEVCLVSIFVLSHQVSTRQFLCREVAHLQTWQSWSLMQTLERLACLHSSHTLPMLQNTWQHVLWLTVSAICRGFTTFEDPFFGFDICRPTTNKLMLNRTVNQQSMKVCTNR